MQSTTLGSKYTSVIVTLLILLLVFPAASALKLSALGWGDQASNSNSTLSNFTLYRPFKLKGKVIVNLEGSKSESWGIQVTKGPKKYVGEEIGLGSWTEMEEELKPYLGEKIVVKARNVDQSWVGGCACSMGYCIPKESIIGWHVVDSGKIKLKGEVIVRVEGSKSESWGILVKDGPKKFIGQQIGLGSWTEMKEELKPYLGEEIAVKATEIDQSWVGGCACAFSHCIPGEDIIFWSGSSPQVETVVLHLDQTQREKREITTSEESQASPVTYQLKLKKN